jgi:mono/diheme cytochrome c family protein
VAGRTETGLTHLFRALADATALAVGSPFAFVLAASLLVPVHARVTVADQFDAAGLYKTKCVACHGAAADKRFDKAKAD